MEGLVPHDFAVEGWFEGLREEPEEHPVLWMKHDHDTASYSLEELSDVEIDEDAGICYPYSDVIPLSKYQEGWDCAGMVPDRAASRSRALLTMTRQASDWYLPFLIISCYARRLARPFASGGVLSRQRLRSDDLQYERAKEAFGPLLEADVAGAHSFLCEMYWKGIGGYEKDEDRARHHYDRLLALVDDGDPEAFMMLAFQYDDGVLVEKDSAKAIEYWRKAADLGHAVAIRVLACCHLNGLNDTPIDAERALAMLRQAAAMGDRHANYQLGLLYQGSTILPHDIRRALKYYKYSADRGYSYALAAIGDLYYDRIGLQRDYAKAFEMYERAMDRGYTRPLCDIGAMYFYGLHKEQSYERAFKLMMDALKRDCTTGRVFVGLMLFYDLGLPEDALEQVRALPIAAAIPENLAALAEDMNPREKTALSLLALDAANDSDSSLQLAVICYEQCLKQRQAAISKELPRILKYAKLSPAENSLTSAILARSMPTPDLLPALDWSYRSATHFNAFGRILSLWLPLASSLDMTSTQEVRHVVPRTRTSILVEVVRRLPEACSCPSLARRLHMYLAESCEAGCSLALEMKANLCAEGLGLTNGVPDLSLAMALYSQAAMCDAGDSFSILFNFQVCVAELGKGSHWTPAYHRMYSDRFKTIVSSLFVLWQRDDTPFAMLPLEIMYQIIRAIEPLPPTAAPVVRSLLASERLEAQARGELFEAECEKLEKLPEIVVKTMDLMEPPLPEHTKVLGKLAVEWKVIPDSFRLCHRFYHHAEECMGDNASAGKQEEL